MVSRHGCFLLLVCCSLVHTIERIRCYDLPEELATGIRVLRILRIQADSGHDLNAACRQRFTEDRQGLAGLVAAGGEDDRHLPFAASEGLDCGIHGRGRFPRPDRRADDQESVLRDIDLVRYDGVGCPFAGAEDALRVRGEGGVRGRCPDLDEIAPARVPYPFGNGPRDTGVREVDNAGPDGAVGVCLPDHLPAAVLHDARIHQLELFPELADPVAIDGVIDIESIAPRINEPLALQGLQVLGDRRLGDPEPDRQPGNPELPALIGSEQVDDLETGEVAECLECPGHDGDDLAEMVAYSALVTAVHGILYKCLLIHLYVFR
jgi:hypothetical protein